MASVWKRLQRVNKSAAKFQYTASYHRVDLETSPKWKPNKLSIVWTRRSRRVVTEPHEWEPSLKDPLKGSVIFTAPENHTVAVTLFKDSRNELEDKDWTFVLEDVSPGGKRRRLAACAINMRRHASLEPSQRMLTLSMTAATNKVVAASIHLTLHCVLLREGQATDEDMQSLASLLSVNNNSDIAVLEDLDEDDYTLSDNSTRQMADFRQQMEELTQSLTNSDIAATPNSVQSLNFDNARTPTAPASPDIPTPTPVPKDLEDQKTEKFKPETLNVMKLKTELPKFTSTPKKPVAETKPDVLLKGVVFKPTQVVRRNLKPLELKTNLNSISLDRNDNEKTEDGEKTPTGEVDALVPAQLDKDKTPVQDLLEWCQAATREYKPCRVTNLTTSFRNGLALCAIIHRYRPDLIDFSALQAKEAERNVRVALEASGRLGISQVLSAGDVCRASPDRLAIMTYLFQLRAHFTGSELQVEQLGNDETESSYLVGRHDTDGDMPCELFSREVATRRSKNIIPRTGSQDQESRPEHTADRITPDKSSPTAIKDVRNMLLTSKNILGKMLSPPPKEPQRPTTKWFADPLRVTEVAAPPARLMTRRELTDPFASDTEDSPPPAPVASSGDVTTDGVKSEPKRIETDLPPTEPKEPSPETRPAKTPDDSPKKSSPEPTKPMTDEDRQAALRERARKLIADARAGIVSPTSPFSPSRPRGTMEIISKQSVMDEIAAAGGVDALLARNESERSSPDSRRSSLSPDRSERESSDTKSTKSCVSGAGVTGDTNTANTGVTGGTATPTSGPGGPRKLLLSFSAVLERLTPDKDLGELDKETGSYIQSELEALEREQKSIDERAAALEKQLRRVMESADNTEEESRLMSQWFNLVNKKNALLRRQMQLNILEQEEDLSRRCELLSRELRLSLAVDEWRKTPGQKRRELLLLQDLLSAVNERDRLVQEMDEQEKAIADDDAIERNLSQVEIQRKNNCLLQ